jgi:hypothetical protein
VFNNLLTYFKSSPKIELKSISATRRKDQGVKKSNFKKFSNLADFLYWEVFRHGNSNQKEFFDFDHGKVPHTKVKPKKGVFTYFEIFGGRHSCVVVGMRSKLKNSFGFVFSVVENPRVRKIYTIWNVLGLFENWLYLGAVQKSANFQYFGSKISKIRSFSVIFLLTKFGDGGYRMSYWATEMDFNSIFGELLKYVSKLLNTLYFCYCRQKFNVFKFWEGS